MRERVGRPGFERLWLWFGLGRASWLTLPRVLMHGMPDDWQERMAELLEEFDSTWTFSDGFRTQVSVSRAGRFVRMPEWLGNYRHPHRADIESARVKARPDA